MKPTKQEVQDKLFKIICEQLTMSSDEFILDSRFQEDMELDSVDAVQLTLTCEDSFGISIDDATMISLQTVGEAAEFIYEKLQNK